MYEFEIRMNFNKLLSEKEILLEVGAAGVEIPTLAITQFL